MNETVGVVSGAPEYRQQTGAVAGVLMGDHAVQSGQTGDDEWRAAGFLRAESAEAWREAGFEPLEAAAWYEIDVRGPLHAAELVAIGLDPGAAGKWFAIDVTDTEVIASLVSHDITPLDAAMWALEVPGQLRRLPELLEQGANPAEVKGLMRLGLDDAVAVEWVLSPAKAVRGLWTNAHRWAAWCSPAEALTWWRSDVGDPGAAQAWRRRGVDPAEAQRWAAAGFGKVEDAEPWRTSSIDSDRAARYLALGVGIRDAVALERLGYDLDAIEQEIEAGWHRILGWAIDNRMSAERLSEWRSADWSLEAIKVWSRAGFSPSEAQPWRQIGVKHPREVASWQQMGLPLSSVALLLQDGHRDPAAVRAWIDLGIQPEEIATWEKAGFDAFAAKLWSRRGHSTKTALQWTRHGVLAPDLADVLTQRKVSPTAAKSWLQDTGVRLERLIDWVDAGFTVSDAVDWVAVSIVHPAVARMFVDRGVAAEAVGAMLAAGYDPDSLSRLASTGWPTPTLQEQFTLGGVADEWMRSGIPPEQWTAWLQLCGRHSVAIAVHRDGVRLEDLASIHERYEVQPRQWSEQDLRTLGARQVIERDLRISGVSSAQLPAAVARVAADEAAGEQLARDVREARWRKLAKDHGLWPRVGEHRLRRLFSAMHAEKVDWVSARQVKFSGGVQADLVDDVQERARLVSEALSLRPVWPVVFEGSVKIVLDGSEPYVLAWVGSESRGVVVGFHVETFELIGRIDDDKHLYAAGLAIAWFLDCCIAIRRGSSLLRRVHGDGDEAQARYNPTVEFDRHLQALRRGVNTPPGLHQVRGFVRTMPDHFQASEQAQNEAPPSIRRNLESNQTWVRPHMRGAGEALKRDLIDRLGKYSALADALGWRPDGR